MRNILCLLVIVVSSVAAGCASSVPSAEFKKPIADAMRLCATDEAIIKLTTAEDVSIDDPSRQRLESRLQQAIQNKKKAVQCKSDVKRIFVLNSRITRYEPGSEFARFMLAGLGQIHIDGSFVLSLPPDEASAAEFFLTKTFAWGGMYGALTKITDIEPVFAEGVADAIIAQAAEEAEKK
ncbi:hypothetical protein FO488_05055 [Geobacter sp. FeAm09]|uniref:hypothetical protein n=1 Tax=Geobacter sp. FeAm09 TaxID=2597769 RepID=UPI0011EC3623|nr:hypothetical protein [Geobacter sp. FeAm09]QEM67581.1 hypothetical protein FO488_05055 [Geobacter sp. FeAm09]